MTRDETVALFLECEAQRGEARAAALGEGKSEDSADEIAHQTARAHWNGWAEKQLSRRKLLEKKGRWADETQLRFNGVQFEIRAALQRKGDDPAPPIPASRRFKYKFRRRFSFRSPIEPVVTCHGATIDFAGFIFPGDTYFNGATFSHNTSFRSACFHGNVSFSNTTFACDTWLDDAIFYGRVSFCKVNFIGDAAFYKCNFKKSANFELATFKQYASFEKSLFSAAADLFAIRGERAFNLRKTVFEDVLDFIQAHFEEPPRLDNMEVRGIPRHPQPDRRRCYACSAINSCLIPHHPRPDERKTPPWWMKGLWKALYWGGQMRSWPQRLLKCGWKRVRSRVRSRMGARDIPSRWLAVQGHDTERELEFHARELRSQRFAEDWPLPFAFWRRWAWGSFFRFWSGYCYQWFSDFGRSLARPFIASLVVLVAAAAFYLSQTEVMQRELALQEASYLSATIQTARYALSNTVPCYSPPPTLAGSARNQWFWWRRAPKIDPDASRIGGLIEPFRSQTNARAEALHLAFRNAFVVLDGSGEAAYRTYGCLYGVELYGGSNPLAVVPSAVSTVSAAQKLFSALMIFLFGLALRNMLKMK